MVRLNTLGIAIVVVSTLAACGETPNSPTSGTPSRASVMGAHSAVSWGPESPHFNLQVILRGDGFGHVKFRQPNDDAFIVHLDTWIRGLAPNTNYLLQRAVDTVVDDICTSAVWLTLGRGPTPQAITTDDKGTGREELWRQVPPSPGAQFDIHFRVINEATSAVVLTSECYQFTISQ
jgi:hypothetical protein